MRKRLITTSLSAFTPLNIKGEQPLYAYRKTLALISSRMGGAETGFLAEPRVSVDGKNIEWYSDEFKSAPRPLSRLEASERETYMRKLSAIMSAYRNALPEPDDDAYPLMTRLAIVADEDCIYCGEGKVVITQWGMRPKKTADHNELNLLKLGSVPKRTVPEPPQDETGDKEVVADDTSDIQTTPESETKTETETKTEIKTETHNNTKTTPPAVPPGADNPLLPPRPAKKRKWLKWLLIALALLLLLLGLWFLLKSCSSANAETVKEMKPVAPPVVSEEITISEDSLNYIASDRLNVYVLKGGDLDDFSRAFRKEWADKQKYVMFNPDTTLKRIVLKVPSAELSTMKKEIPARLKDFEIVVTEENIYRKQGKPNDPALGRQELSYYLDMVNAYNAWDIEQGSEDVVVAILDGDIDVTHPEIKAKIVAPYDAVTHTSHVPRVEACEGHGTHTSSTAVGFADNGQGSAGIAPGCKLMPINVFTDEGYSYDSLQVDGIMYAISNGADVISMSIGAFFSPMTKFIPPEEQALIAANTNLEEQQMWDKIYAYAEEKGVTIVKSAGNENILSALDPQNRSSHVLIVSAVDQRGEQSIFDPMTLDGSNYGDVCRISAPGSDIFHAVPGGFSMMSGTSMSCPMVAGGAALLKSNKPDLSPEQIRNILVATANPQPKADIGPIMDLAAALQADPDNLPATPPVNPGRIPSPKQPENPFQPVIGYKPTPSPMPQPTPQTPGEQNRCDLIRYQYETLEQARRQLEQELQRLKENCPECFS